MSEYRYNREEPEWYPAEIHERVLTLDEWGDEIAFRLGFMQDVRKRRKDIYSFDKGYVQESELKMFSMGLIDKNIRFSILAHGSDMGEPIEVHDHSLNQDTRDFSRGMYSSWRINLAYDDKTLIDEFKMNLREFRQGIEYKRLGENLRSTAYGKRLYTDRDAESWFDQKVLDWIDLMLWRELKDVGYSQANVAEMIGVSEASIHNTLIKRERELMSGIGLMRIRASAKKNKLHK